MFVYGKALIEISASGRGPTNCLFAAFPLSSKAETIFSAVKMHITLVHFILLRWRSRESAFHLMFRRACSWFVSCKSHEKRPLPNRHVIYALQERNWNEQNKSKKRFMHAAHTRSLLLCAWLCVSCQQYNPRAAKLLPGRTHAGAFLAFVCVCAYVNEYIERGGCFSKVVRVGRQK